ncbi:MAG: sigma-70 family RNA polymerase sigma factor [Planctomycetota bacterium]|nr:sigma-70 family RNA polymerase sigma factor [Planctomycetota bacterium]
MVERSDRALVEMSLHGDTDAYGELVARHHHAVRLLAKGIVKDYQHAEDLAQEAFIRAYHSLADLNEPEKFGGWVATILRRVALDYLRLSRNAVSLEVLQEEGFEPCHPAPEVAPVMIETEEDNARVLEALRNLREDYREIIILKHVENLSYKELASRLNMSVSAVGEKLSRVRALLKRRLEKRSVGPHP